jgi:hypothetical protein
LTPRTQTRRLMRCCSSSACAEPATYSSTAAAVRQQ